MSLKLGSNDTAILAGSSVVKQMLLGSSPKFAAPVLDHVPGAAAAYSLRRLSNAYTGPVVKVRRSSDSTTADFTAAEVVDGTLTAWVGAGDGFVRTWYDQSGNARNATQATAGYQPKVVSSGVLVTEGGKAAMRFDGTGDFLDLPASLDASLWDNSFTLFAQLKYHSLTGYNYLLSAWGSRDVTIACFTTNSIRFNVFAGSANAVDSFALNAGDDYVFVYTRSKTDGMRLHNNGVQEDSNLSTVNASARANSNAIGARYAGDRNDADYSLKELIIYPSDVSASRELAEGEMAWHYGLQSKLPYNHAYAPQAIGGASQTVPTDSDAIAYLAAVAAADGSAVERSVAIAIDDFVKGLKADGLWSAIGSACVLAGARTVAGALVPLKGAAPTGYNWTASDYSRSLGLKGNGTTKYIDSNRANNADPQDDQHIAVYAASASTSDNFYYGSDGIGINGSSGAVLSSGDLLLASRGTGYATLSGKATATGLIATSRESSGSFTSRVEGANSDTAVPSATPTSQKIFVFCRNDSSSGATRFVDARLGFFSLGQSLDLALLDARVSALMSAIGAAL